MDGAGIVGGAESVAYVPIPVAGLASLRTVTFPLYVRTAVDTWVLYRDPDTHVGDEALERLVHDGTPELYIRAQDRPVYLHLIEGSLGEILVDRRTSVERRADVLHGVATVVADEVLTGLDREGLRRSQRLLVNASALVLREQGAFAALRSLMGASHSLAQHSVTVAFLALGLARHVLAPDPTTLVHAGLGGLFHDIGRVGFEDLEHDPDHAERGHALLQRCRLPREVRDAALAHHERIDGSGFPQRLTGEQIPPIAHLVGIVDVFDEVYSGQHVPIGVFDALRILAQAYRGCFEERVAMSFVRLFR